MSYLCKDTATKAIRSMSNFHEDIVSTYENHGMDLLDNLGRRNIVMSQAQERFFAMALMEKFGKGVINDGRTGQPDIVIEPIGKELECKLTSRHKSGSISFQSDYETLLAKGELDYLYVIADHHFKQFAVLHFQGLTTEDFRPLSNGARGKVAMFKHKGMKKCNVLMGSVDSLNKENIDRIKKCLSEKNPPYKIRKLKKSLDYWMNTEEKYRFNLEKLS